MAQTSSISNRTPLDNRPFGYLTSEWLMLRRWQGLPISPHHHVEAQKWSN